MTFRPSKWAPAFVTVTAGALLVSACKKTPDTHQHTQNPPIPEPMASNPPEPDPVPPTNPPAPEEALASWDDVKSSHPPGATNPPSPMLLLTVDGQCHKYWWAGMMKFPADAKTMDVGGTNYNVRVLTELGAALSGATTIKCPAGADKVLADNKDAAVPPTAKP